MTQLIHKQNPNAGELIDCLNQAVRISPSMPFAIQVLTVANGMAYVKYYSLDTTYPIMPFDDNLNLRANLAENAPYTTVECTLKCLLPYEGSDKAVKVDISVPGSQPGVLKSIRHDVVRVDSNYGLSLEVKVHIIEDAK